MLGGIFDLADGRLKIADKFLVDFSFRLWYKFSGSKNGKWLGVTQWRHFKQNIFQSGKLASYQHFQAFYETHLITFSENAIEQRAF